MACSFPNSYPCSGYTRLKVVQLFIISPLVTLTQLYSVLVPANEHIVTQNRNNEDVIYLSVVV